MTDFKDSIKKINRLVKYMERDALVVIGTEAVNHFKESFDNEGFTDRTLEKWEEVERRKEGRWKGFQYGSTIRRPGTKTRKSDAITNYSPAAEQRKILTGTTMELAEGIDYVPNGKGVTVYATAIYAKLQNEGGEMKVFGKASRTMKARRFMGQSEALRNKIRAIIYKDINNILK